MKVAVIGAGTMGHGIAQLFAMNGYEVFLVDVNEEVVRTALQKIEKSLDKFVKKQMITGKESVLEKIKTSTNFNDAKDVDLVVEAASEKQEIKKKIFENLDQICKKETILASNTSSIPITKLGNFTKRPEKVIGLHFFNPPQIMKLVEVILGEKTSPETKNKVIEISENLGKTPVTVIDSPAFVTSRLIMIMINEAVQCLYEKIATKEDIDTAMKLGMNHPMGPLELADLVGLDIVLAIVNTMYEGFKDEKYKPSPLLVEKVEKGELGRKTGKGFYDYEK
ncbi:NAD(P)-binding domain-containing protein [Candidatus Woesearchaeota archaeon]|nr:NAD(P)-binding domain-containing protein [Candidatus Woesearchaeota archaeon]